LLGELCATFGTMTSLIAACFHGYADIVKRVLQCVTPHTVNIQCGRYCDSALNFVMCYFDGNTWARSLHGACGRSSIHEVRNLVHGPNNVDVADQRMCTPLHVACRIGNLDIVQLLLPVFASVDITEDGRLTSLDVAILHGNEVLVPYMSQLLDVTNHTASSSTASNVRPTNSATRATVDCYCQ
jgi:ankyrin repeat protein